jgi:hypothetical protein
MAQGAVLQWHEFEFMFSYFPGQTLLHDSLLVKRASGETVLFVGDSFTPSGLDDYCLWNRNFLAAQSGFLRCLEDLQKLPPDHLLVNQHVEPAFRFSSDQLTFMIQSLQLRAEAMERLFPWPNINYGIDEQWARLMPYESSVTPGRPFELRSVIWNHLPKEQEYRVHLVLPEGWASDRDEYRLRAPAQSEGAVSMRITPGVHSRDLAIVLVDVDFGPWQLRQWSEAIVKLI